MQSRQPSAPPAMQGASQRAGAGDEGIAMVPLASDAHLASTDPPEREDSPSAAQVVFHMSADDAYTPESSRAGRPPPLRTGQYTSSSRLAHAASEPAPDSLPRRGSISISHRAYHHGQSHDEVNEEELARAEPLSPRSTAAAIHAAELEAAAAAEKLPQPEPTERRKKLAPSESAAHVADKYRDVFEVANTETGLSDEVVAKQLEKFGYNETVEEQKPLWLVFLSKFYGLTPFMIMAAIAIAWGLEKWADGAVIAALLLLNGIIGFNEDLRARKALAELVQKMQVMARAKRNGEWLELPARELVPGDLVRVRTGDIGGADLVILNGELQVDQSALTGESALKSMRRNGVMYAGSIIRRGEANALVVATAANTFFGQTAKLVQSSKPNPHIDRILNRVVGVLMTLVLILIVVTLIVMGAKGDDLVEALPLLLMVVVSALPVALPAMFTVAMALGSQELSRRSVLVTRLNVLEDAAMMAILFSDKTGTLSQNKLSVEGVTAVAPDVTEEDIMLTAALCAKRENSDPTDIAFLDHYEKLAREHNDQGKLHLYPSVKRSAYESLNFKPFDASNRRTEATAQYTINGTTVQCKVSKGAVATLCRMSGIETVDSNPEWKRIDAMVEANAAKGFRTLGVAKGDVGGDLDNPKWTFLGLVALFDPPREDSLAVVTRLRELGIQTKMLTGDAIGVGREMGSRLTLGTNFVNLEHEKEQVKEYYAKHGKLSPDEPDETRLNVTDGKNGADANAPAKNDKAASATPASVSEVEDLESRVMHHLLDRYDPLEISGFAQIFPSDKHFIVKHTQEKGFICGMTGDGVNDAPALKQAEVGCAVSDATDVAKGSASALLLDEGLSGVVQVVEVGRQVHRRVEVWVINKAAKASQHSVFILVMYLILGRFPISALGVVMLLLLMDFVMISLATDIQEPGAAPQGWNLAQLTRVGLVVGLLGAGQMMALILSAEYHSDWSVAWLETFAWECLYMWGMLSLFSVREKSFFWSSRPSWIMLGIVVVEVLAVWIVCAVGFEGFLGIGWGYSSGVVGIALGCFVLNDAVKTLYVRAFEHEYLAGTKYQRKKKVKTEQAN